MFLSYIAPTPSTSWYSGTSGRKIESESRSSGPSGSAVDTVSWSLFTSVWEIASASRSSGSFSRTTSASTYSSFCLSVTAEALTA